jgi:hypothetical protein
MSLEHLVPLPKPTRSTAVDEEEHSPMFNYYRQHFKNIGGQLTYEQLRTMLPERFDLAVLDVVFQSWHAVTNGKLGALTLNDPTARFEIVFEHDHHLYRSDSYISHCINKQDTERKLNIKLPNNGFIYPHFSVFKSAAPRHRSTTFVKLDRSHLNQFPHLIAFAKLYLNASEVHCQLFYDYENYKFDFKAFSNKNRNDGICFCFHQFDPVDDEFDEDYWLTV